MPRALLDWTDEVVNDNDFREFVGNEDEASSLLVEGALELELFFYSRARVLVHLLQEAILLDQQQLS